MNSPARTCLVTGAAGFIGSHLAERLLQENHAVIGIDCFTPYYARERKEANLKALCAHPQFELIEGDLRTLDLTTMLRERGVQVVFHEAGQAGVRASWGLSFDEYVHHNIEATQKLLEAVKDLPLERLVFASSSSVYGDAERFPTDEEVLPRPVSPYGVTKLAAEHLTFLYARQFQVPAVALRYFTVYGPRQRPDMAFYKFIDALVHDRPVSILGDGQQTREFTFVDDIVQANLLAMCASPASLGRVYNIGGGTRTVLKNVLNELEAVSGRTPRVEYRPAAAGDARHTAADIRRAATELGYAPRVGLREGLTRQFDWQKEQTGGHGLNPV